MKLRSILACGLCAAAVVHAQSPQKRSPAADAPPPADWMVPIHTQQDDPMGGAYGHWAAGPDYKVAFDDGFTFYPVLGDQAPRNLPMRWRTDRITVGGRVIVDHGTKAEASATDWRYELRYPHVTEAYDVLPEGVEQTFVLDRPIGAGDVVVQGRIESPLQARAAGFADQDLSFTDESGREIVRYGKALAIDARDRHMPVQTCFDGETVRLRLTSDMLRDAVYPVVIDPLTSTSTVSTIFGATIDPGYLAVGRDDLNNEIMVAYTRATSATDWDLYVRVYEDDFTFLGSPYSDITAGWSTRSASTAFVREANRWALAFHRDFVSSSGVRIYFQQGGLPIPGTGQLTFLSTVIGQYDRFPSIAGETRTQTADAAYVVFQRDIDARDTANSRVLGATVQAGTASIGLPTNLHTSSIPSYDAEWPQITQDAYLGSSWVAVWQEFNYANPNDDWDIIAQRIEQDGTLAGTAALGPDGDATRHKLHPVVAGSNDFFMVSFTMRPNLDPSSASTGNEIAVQRFDWSETSASPVERPTRILVRRPGNDLRAAMGGRAIDFDNNTRSHWAVAYADDSGDLRVARTGFRGRVVEEAVVYSHATIGATPPAVCYNDDDYEFVIGYGLDAAPSSVLVRRLQYHPDARNDKYGVSCGGLNILPDNPGARNHPYAGSEHFVFTAWGMANTATVLMVSPNPAPSLTQIAPGCFLWLDPVGMVAASIGVTDPGGFWTAQMPLIDSVVSADLYWQMVQAPVAGGLLSSDGLHTVIR
ncbi:MAG: hypothetical protein AAF628_09970 [Planctomycetota bacterium]